MLLVKRPSFKTWKRRTICQRTFFEPFWSKQTNEMPRGN